MPGSAGGIALTISCLTGSLTSLGMVPYSPTPIDGYGRPGPLAISACLRDLRQLGRLKREHTSASSPKMRAYVAECRYEVRPARSSVRQAIAGVGVVTYARPRILPANTRQPTYGLCPLCRR